MKSIALLMVTLLLTCGVAFAGGEYKAFLRLAPRNNPGGPGTITYNGTTFVQNLPGGTSPIGSGSFDPSSNQTITGDWDFQRMIFKEIAGAATINYGVGYGGLAKSSSDGFFHLRDGDGATGNYGTLKLMNVELPQLGIVGAASDTYTQYFPNTDQIWWFAQGVDRLRLSTIGMELDNGDQSLLQVGRSTDTGTGSRVIVYGGDTDDPGYYSMESGDGVLSAIFAGDSDEPRWVAAGNPLTATSGEQLARLSTAQTWVAQQTHSTGYINASVGGTIAATSVYGNAYINNETGVSVAIATGGTYVPVNNGTSWTVGTVKGANYMTGATTGILTAGAYAAGVYEGHWQITFGGSANEVYHAALHRNGTILPSTTSARKLPATPSDQGSMNGFGIFTLASTQTVRLYITSTTDTKTATVYHAKVLLKRVESTFAP